MKKIIFALIILLGLGGAAFASSQAGWVGTGWLTNGSVISSQPLKSNLDYLFENKVQKPFNCTGENERLTWRDGQWQCEDFVIGDPEIEPVNNCVFNGTTVADGSSVNAYEESSVPFGESCSVQTRTCTDGDLSGTFINNNCVIADPGSCSFPSGPVPHGQQVVAYESATVPFGETCVEETRRCSNGNLSGTFTNTSCRVGPADSCTFAGETVSHGQDVTAYQAASVDAPNSCVSEIRTCTDGDLSGSFTHNACSVIAGACTSQDLTFFYDGLFETNTTGTNAESTGGLRKITSCTVPAELVPNAEEGFSKTFSYGDECKDNGDTYSEVNTIEHVHRAQCGSSGWELSSTPLFQQCTDEGQVVGTRVGWKINEALIEVIDERCDCGVAFTGGKYQGDIVCAGFGR